MGGTLHVFKNCLECNVHDNGKINSMQHDNINLQLSEKQLECISILHLACFVLGGLSSP